MGAIGGGFGNFRDKQTQDTTPVIFGGPGKGGSPATKPVIDIRDKAAEEAQLKAAQAQAMTGRNANIFAGGVNPGGQPSLLSGGRSYRRGLLGY